MPQLRCTNCDETSNIQVDDESRMVCGACGTILEENVLVAQVEFQENPAGTSSVVGQFVSNALTRRYGKHAESLTSSSSREAAVAAANRKIESLARQLNIDKPTVLQANQYHRMAQDYGFVRGRRTEYVVAVCLYLACRMREGPYMLIDFSALLGINLFVLGQVYLKFSQRLEMVTIPLIDPALYVRRFASLLEFEDKLESVINTTVRLIARMQRDWIVQGRRPTSVCGAALLIAARMHGFHRTQREVITLLKLCENTLRQRMEEFQSTPSSKLTIDEFWAYDLPEEADPPAFAKQNALELQDESEDELLLAASAKEADALKLVIDDEDDDAAAQGSKETTSVALVPAQLPPPPPPSEPGLKRRAQRARAMQEEKRKAYEDIHDSLEEALAVAGGASQASSFRDLSSRDSGGVVKVNIEPDAPQRSARERAEERRRRDGILDTWHSLSDYDDDVELNGYILTAEEHLRKEKIWDSMNKKYLELHPAHGGAQAAEAKNAVPKLKDSTRGRKPRKKPGQMPDMAPADILAASAGARVAGRAAAPEEAPARLDMSAAVQRLFGNAEEEEG